MSTKPQAHGYSTFIVEQENAFYPVGTQVKGHEFRYSVVESWDGAPEELALRMERGTGFQEKRDGLVKKNVLALYTHVIAPGTPEWVAGLLRAGRSQPSVLEGQAERSNDQNDAFDQDKEKPGQVLLSTDPVIRKECCKKLTFLPRFNVKLN